jgi:hypothetical protein
MQAPRTNTNRSSPRKRGPRCFYKRDVDQNAKSLDPRLRGEERIEWYAYAGVPSASQRAQSGPSSASARRS